MEEPKNPFVHDLKLPPLQVVKMLALGVTLLPLRLLMALLCIVLSTGLAMIGTRGLSRQQLDAAPFTGWRVWLLRLICCLLRIMFWCAGFRVRVRGEKAAPQEAPILAMAPHSTFFDVLAVAVMDAPSVVAKAGVAQVPGWGKLVQMTQPILVDRSDPNSRHNTIKQITDRAEGAENPGWQQVLIFPEGTCTNRSSLITFQCGAFYPGVAVQPVVIRYDNEWDTVSWTWEGPGALQVLLTSLTQFYVNLSVEFMPVYQPNQQEVKDPKLFANNVRQVMADRLGVPTTNSNFFDYLKMEKCKNMLKKVQKLQMKMEFPMMEATHSVESQEPLEAAALLGVPADLPELAVVEELCGSGSDLRNLRLIARMATEENAYKAFLDQAFLLFDPEFGADKISVDALHSVLSIAVFLNSKESKDVTDSIAKHSKEEGDIVEKDDLACFLETKKPNYVKIVRCWEGGLTGILLAVSAETSKWMENAGCLLSTGKEVVTASRERVKDAVSSAASSLHKRTGSRSEMEEKKSI